MCGANPDPSTRLYAATAGADTSCRLSEASLLRTAPPAATGTTASTRTLSADRAARRGGMARFQAHSSQRQGDPEQHDDTHWHRALPSRQRGVPAKPFIEDSIPVHVTFLVPCLAAVTPRRRQRKCESGQDASRPVAPRARRSPSATRTTRRRVSRAGRACWDLSHRLHRDGCVGLHHRWSGAARGQTPEHLDALFRGKPARLHRPVHGDRDRRLRRLLRRDLALSTNRPTPAIALADHRAGIDWPRVARPCPPDAATA